MQGVPEKLINFRVYDSLSQELLGVADVELPSFEAMTETITGAGIAGEYESPTLGHFGSQVLKLSWRTTTAKVLGLLAPVQHRIDVRGAVQVQVPALGTVAPEAFRCEVRGMRKSGDTGKLAPGSPMEATTEIECTAVSIFVNNLPVVIYDKLSYVFIVNGVDYLAAARVAMGGV